MVAVTVIFATIFQPSPGSTDSYSVKLGGRRSVGIVKLSEFEQKLGDTRIHHALIVQHTGSWAEGDNQPTLTEVDITETRPIFLKLRRIGKETIEDIGQSAVVGYDCCGGPWTFRGLFFAVRLQKKYLTIFHMGNAQLKFHDYTR